MSKDSNKCYAPSVKNLSKPLVKNQRHDDTIRRKNAEVQVQYNVIIYSKVIKINRFNLLGFKDHYKF